MSEFDPIIDGFLDYKRSINKTKPTSIKDMKCSYRKLQNFLVSSSILNSPWEIELEDYIQYIDYLRRKGEKGSGISKQLSHIRSLLDYCWRTGHSNRNVLKSFDVQDNDSPYRPTFLTINETEKLINSLEKASRVLRKERLIILLLYALGLRTSELCHIKFKDIDLEKQDIFVKGKFDIERRMPVPDTVWMELLSYMHECNSKNGTLFKTEQKRRPLGIADVGDIVKKYVSKCGIDKDVTPKTLRHTFACHLMENGVDISVISSLMGHKSPRETGVYIHAYEESKKKSISGVPKILGEES